MKKEGKEKRRERRYEVVSLHMESHQPDGILLVVIAGLMLQFFGTKI
jgi:hypothetical protein